MSIEIEEDYEKLNGFYFLLTYVYFLRYQRDAKTRLICERNSTGSRICARK